MDPIPNPNQSKSPNINSYNTNSNGTSDPNRKESIEQYTIRKRMEQQNKRNLAPIPPAPYTPPQKSSLAALKQEQEEAKKVTFKKKKKKRKRKKKAMKKFKPTTNLHTIRLCLYKVIIPTSVLGLFCVIVSYFVKGKVWGFTILALLAQILTFVQVSALYTSLLWCIGIEWQAFACGVAEIGFHLAGDGISPGLVSNLLLGDGFKYDILVLIVVMLVSILIFFISWKFVDFQIWNITKNSKNSKFFKLLHEETTLTSSLTTTTDTNSRRYEDEEYNSDSYEDTSNGTDNEDSDSNDSDYSQTSTNDNSEYDSQSDWHPDNY